MSKKNYQFTHLDASESVYFNRQLETIEAETKDVQYPDLLARSLLPVDSSGPSSKKVVTYRQFDRVGMAKMISSYADDLPRVNGLAKEFSVLVKTGGVSFGFTLDELKLASEFNQPLDSTEAYNAAKANEELIERVAQLGDAPTGLLGLLNQPNANTYTLPTDGTGSSATFASKTGDLVIRDLNNIAFRATSLTNGVEKNDVMLFPLSLYMELSTRRMSDSSDLTILEFFLKNSPYVKQVVPWYVLQTAGAGSTRRIVSYTRSPGKLKLIIPQEHQQEAPQVHGLETIVPTTIRTGGVLAYYPMSITYSDGS